MHISTKEQSAVIEVMIALGVSTSPAGQFVVQVGTSQRVFSQRESLAISQEIIQTQNAIKQRQKEMWLKQANEEKLKERRLKKRRDSRKLKSKGAK